MAAHAADFPDPLPHYVRAGGSFACVTDKADLEKGQKENRDVCLTIGPLFVGMARTDAETVLGKPVTSVPVGARQAFAYSLQKDEAGRMVTYAVLTYGNDGRADTVQVTGKPWPGQWQFSGLSLGTSETAATARMGAPLSTQKSDQPGTVQWDYRPWTFSFEVTAGAITSIRLAQ